MKRACCVRSSTLPIAVSFRQTLFRQRSAGCLPTAWTRRQGNRHRKWSSRIEVGVECCIRGYQRPGENTTSPKPAAIGPERSWRLLAGCQRPSVAAATPVRRHLSRPRIRHDAHVRHSRTAGTTGTTIDAAPGEVHRHRYRSGRDPLHQPVVDPRRPQPLDNSPAGKPGPHRQR